MRKKQKYELLAPAGGFPQLVAAVKAGADAVYFGLQEFSMRANAKNFEIKDLKKINNICGKNVKKYVTINIIVYDNELNKLDKTLKKIKGKVDAVICWDLSVIKLCKKNKIPFHISTQASIANTEAAKFYKKLGAERIVLARELSLKDIKRIGKEVNIEIESFCHGAMCVAISGRCFMSQELSGRSANRGMCTQPCRRTYSVKDDRGNELKLEGNTVMSAKDLCTFPFIEKLKSAGIVSFKIEGRSRDPRYVDRVVREYRKALDKKLTKEEIAEGLERLGEVYTKGFSSGFYLGTPTSDDFSKTEHSVATKKKAFVGKVEHYYTKPMVGEILVQSHAVKIGDEISIIGKTTGIENFNIKSMEIEGQPITSAKRGETIGVKLPARVRKGDDVYIVLMA
ncbi:MAG: U32 family peptidase [Nanoarchaeota archaeon]|jgi:putative protease|nr:U32 family peptidase [Nanoarchaeota archaeon]